MEKTIPVNDLTALSAVMGSLNSNIKRLEKQLGVSVDINANGLSIRGDSEAAIDSADVVVQKLLDLSGKGHEVNTQTVSYLSEQAGQGSMAQVLSYSPDIVTVTAKGRPIRSKTNGQGRYIKSIRENEVTFAIGPAGTGKTYLAVALAVHDFRLEKYERIILTRPAVEAGEKLGFLPGDLQTKVDPYMRPLYDALFDLMGAESYQAHMERGTIEVSPLAYMRGRTLDNSFIILDEAQNTTPEQMKMFLTRIGFNSKAVVTGDITQIDLPVDRRSGLKESARILKQVEGISIIELNDQDVVRNGLVQKIIRAYDSYEKRRQSR